MRCALWCMEADAQRPEYWAKHAELKRRYLATLCRALEARSVPAPVSVPRHLAEVRVRVRG